MTTIVKVLSSTTRFRLKIDIILEKYSIYLSEPIMPSFLLNFPFLEGPVSSLKLSGLHLVRRQRIH